MLEKPDLKDEKIIACLQDEYGLEIVQVDFLPLGADRNAAAYRAVINDEAQYFLKLRSGAFNETSVTLLKFLSDRGIKQIVAPLTTKTGQHWANLDTFKVILYPFVDGRSGYEVMMLERHWGEFGTALRKIHNVELPAALIRRIRQETYTPRWREAVKMFMKRIEDDVFDDPAAIKLALFLKAKSDEIIDLVGRAERLAQLLRDQSPEFSLCHSDLHAGNILIGANGAFYIVDWDEPILAPKERDLMYVGGGLMASGHTPQEEETLFYRSYGQTQIDPIALAYYRYERIIQDTAAFCEQLFLTNEGGEDREQSLYYLKSNFLPNSTIEIAYRSDITMRDG